MKKIFKTIFSPFYKKYNYLMNKADKEELDTLYKLLYNAVHDFDNALPLASAQTIDAFGFQWDKLKDGEAMLSDDWFRENVSRIISEEETLIDKDWFVGKEILDCGCGGGRWSYGLAKLGANITAVDINASALKATEEALKDITSVKKTFIHTPLEQLSEKLPADKKYDLIWSWGVLHHCSSFTKSFHEIIKHVKVGGFIYLYLYGRETVNYNADINLFKNRVYYNTLGSWKEKEDFLLKKAKGDHKKIHQLHDMYSPLLNRRLEYDYVKKILEDAGFTDITRTTKQTELNVRAVYGEMNAQDKDYLLPIYSGTKWYEKY